LNEEEVGRGSRVEEEANEEKKAGRAGVCKSAERRGLLPTNFRGKKVGRRGGRPRLVFRRE